MRIFTPAKINLTLDVTGRLEDGYHTLESVFQSVSIYDELDIALASNGISVSCGRGIPGGQRNICWKAAKLMLDKTGADCGVRINIKKQIPAQAGLGGGSSDAAAVLGAMNLLLGAQLSDDALRAAGKTLGADVPFFIGSGAAYVSGIGDIITPIHQMPAVHIVIAKPYAGMPTPLAYKRIDVLEDIPHGNINTVLSGLKSGNLKEAVAGCINSFEAVTNIPEVFNIKRIMRETGAFLSLMSGSGTAVFGLFEERASAEKCRESLNGFPFVRICMPENRDKFYF